MEFIDIQAEYKTIRKKLDQVLLTKIKRGHFILGEYGSELEEKISQLVGVKYSVGVNSGTDALFLSLRALGIGRGGEVITTPFSFVATAEVIAQCEARPVFVDIDPASFNIDVSKIEKAVTRKTKAIMPVHLYGQMAPITEVIRLAKKYHLFVIEDAAQAIGAKQKIGGRWRMAGGLGDVGCLSFFPTKNLGAYGDAGMVTTNSKNLAQKIRMLRNHGSSSKYRHEFLGYSSRLDELQAAILLTKLPYLKKWNNRRRLFSRFYDKNLKGVGDIITPQASKNNFHIYHQYTIRTKYRETLMEYLRKRDIPTIIHYPLPLHLQPAFKYLGYKKGDCPNAERAAKEVLSLPIYPELKRADQFKIVRGIKNFFDHASKI